MDYIISKVSSVSKPDTSVKSLRCPCDLALTSWRAQLRSPQLPRGHLHQQELGAPREGGATEALQNARTSDKHIPYPWPSTTMKQQPYASHQSSSLKPGRQNPAWRGCWVDLWEHKHQAPQGAKVAQFIYVDFAKANWRPGERQISWASVLCHHGTPEKAPRSPSGPAVPCEWTKRAWVSLLSLREKSGEGVERAIRRRERKVLKIEELRSGFVSTSARKQYLYWLWTACQSATRLPASLSSQKGLRGCAQSCPRNFGALAGAG